MATDVKFSIRKIQESDIEGFHAALSSVVRERIYLLTVEPPALEDTQKFIRHNIVNNTAEYVALSESQIVGWADILPHQKEVLSHSGLLGMGVISTHRGRGIGSELLRHVIDHAWQQGLTRIELEVFASNVNAFALYKKFGFELEGTKRNARLVDGGYEDVHIMAMCRI